MKLVGKQMVDYTSRKTGKPVNGITLHCLCDNDQVDGKAAETVWVSATSTWYGPACDLPLDCEVVVYYNRFGSVDSLQIINAPHK